MPLITDLINIKVHWESTRENCVLLVSAIMHHTDCLRHCPKNHYFYYFIFLTIYMLPVGLIR